MKHRAGSGRHNSDQVIKVSKLGGGLDIKQFWYCKEKRSHHLD